MICNTMILGIVCKYVQRCPFAKAYFTCNFTVENVFCRACLLTWYYFQEFVLRSWLGEEVMLIHGGSG